MSRIEIESKVKEIIALQFGMTLDEITIDTNFLTDLNADSLDAVEVVMSVEDRFDISIPDEDANNLTTIRSVVDYVEKNFADKGSK